MTVAICSYQRRDSVVRLVQALDEQARRESGWDGVDVVVVVDGSTDGTAAALRAARTSLPLRVVERPHQGLSAARNACLHHASGDLVYFLDDDLVPAEGTVVRHRTADRKGSSSIVLGPCLVPSDTPDSANTRAWYAERYEELARTPHIDRFDRFSIANASGPTASFMDVGGFSTEFVGYGLEDHELGLRLMQRGVFERFDPDAIAWHHTVVGTDATAQRSRESGRNIVRLMRLHPTAAPALLPDRYEGPAKWALDRLSIRSPRILFVVSKAAQWTARRRRLGPRRLRGEVWALAAAAGSAAGVADMDRSLVPRYLGRPEKPTTGRLWRRRPVGDETSSGAQLAAREADPDS